MLGIGHKVTQPDEIKEIASGLAGAIYADTSLTADAQTAEIDAVDQLRATALGEPAAGGPPPVQADVELAKSKLEARGRAAEIPSLDNAAKILTGVTALVTGLFTGIGFSSGDFVRMIRDFWLQGFIFLVAAGLALFLGTFAFVIDAYRSSTNLKWERAAVYVGIICAGVAFGMAAWGLSQGASVGPTRPTISASFNTTASPPALTVSASSADVPRSEHLTTTVWGKDASSWVVISTLVNGPTVDGAVSTSITIDNTASYTELEATAFLTAKNTPSSKTPPADCSADVSCTLLPGPASTPAS
jgi:hypothetical protein